IASLDQRIDLPQCVSRSWTCQSHRRAPFERHPQIGNVIRRGSLSQASSTSPARAARTAEEPLFQSREIELPTLVAHISRIQPACSPVFGALVQWGHTLDLAEVGAKRLSRDLREILRKVDALTEYHLSLEVDRADREAEHLSQLSISPANIEDVLARKTRL